MNGTWVWPDTAVLVAAVIVIAVVGRWLIVHAIKAATSRAVKRAKKRRAAIKARGEHTYEQLAQQRYEQRAATTGSLLRSLVTFTISVVAVLTVLALLGVPLAPILASAGVGGVALGFGAQSLVKDFLSGIAMMIEDQYGVGDIIDTGQVTGTVEDVGLRVTRLRDVSGQVWYVRNGEILRVGNQSQGWSTAVVDVPVAPDEDAASVIALLTEVAAEFDSDPEFADSLIDTPTVAGVNHVTPNQMTILITAKTVPNKHWGVQRALLERSQAALAKAGVRGPIPGGLMG